MPVWNHTKIKMFKYKVGSPNHNNMYLDLVFQISACLYLQANESRGNHCLCFVVMSVSLIWECYQDFKSRQASFNAWKMERASEILYFFHKIIRFLDLCDENLERANYYFVCVHRPLKYWFVHGFYHMKRCYPVA